MKMKKQIKVEGYKQLLKDIKSILQRGLTKAYKAVDNIKVQTYWQIGERIVREELEHKDRADYGMRVIEKLAADLGLSRSSMFYIVEFYKSYPIVQTLSGQLSWSHYITLIGIPDEKKRNFYEAQSIRNSWSVRELKNRIRTNEYENARKKGELVVKLPSRFPVPEEVFKDTYNWDFISLEYQHTERELETALLNNIVDVLLEFGSGFAFVSKQQKVLINGKWHNIDLLFYHILLKCYVIVELKARALMHGDIEQVTKYLTYFREKKTGADRDPVALIICKSHDKIEVYYSAGKDRNDIFVAEYKTKLPSEQEIRSKLKKQTKISKND